MNKKNFKRLFIFLTFFLLFILNCNLTIASEINLPKPEGYVNDFANVINDADKEKIEFATRELNAKTGVNVVVVTVKSLEGRPIEDYSLEIGRQWKLGQKGKNNGIVILVAPNDKKMRIETGYGIEGYITDGDAGRIRDDYMVPYFKNGDFSTGIKYGTIATASILAKNYGVKLFRII